MGEALAKIGQTMLDIMSALIIPDWTALVGLLPVLLVLGVIGPLLSLAALAWVIYALRRPRISVALAEGPLPARLVDGLAVYPAGEPYCTTDRLVHPFGETRCDRCGRDLLLRCPKCDAGRPARVSACPNCGLALSMARRDLALRRAGPPPGGAAAA